MTEEIVIDGSEIEYIEVINKATGQPEEFAITDGTIFRADCIESSYELSFEGCTIKIKLKSDGLKITRPSETD